MAAKSTKIKPEALPPTKRAAHFYSLRVYFQLHEWNNLNSEFLNPDEWSWKLENDRYVPSTTHFKWIEMCCLLWELQGNRMHEH